MIRLAGLEVVTVPQHVDVQHLDVTMNSAALAPGLPRTARALLPALLPLSSALIRTLPHTVVDAILRRLPEGPTDDARARAHVTIRVDAQLHDGTTGSGTIDVHDVYGTTAAIAVEVANQLSRARGISGVLAAAQTLDTTTFLQLLAQRGLRWHVNPATPPTPHLERPTNANPDPTIGGLPASSLPELRLRP